MKSINEDNKLTPAERKELTDHVIQCAVESTSFITGTSISDRWTYEDLVSRVAFFVKESKLQWDSIHQEPIIIGEEEEGEGEDGEGWKST